MEKNNGSIKAELIAPCGMNCELCVNFQAMKQEINKKGFKKTYCPGCQPRGKHCVFMRKTCDLIGKGKIRFCFECEEYPCNRLKNLDKRYRSNYHMSMLENLESIRADGIEKFVENEKAKWHCPKCGQMICCHNGLCLNCDLEKLQQNKQYCWDEEKKMDKEGTKSKTIDAYIKQFPADVQEKLTQLRMTIQETAPEAQEKISYQMPTFYLHGNLVHFAAYKNHIGFYPTPSGIEQFKEQLSAYKHAKGSVQFPLDEPLPLKLITEMVQARIIENKKKAEEKTVLLKSKT